jgi:hemerythrin-like metal-binding protein
LTKASEIAEHTANAALEPVGAQRRGAHRGRSERVPLIADSDCIQLDIPVIDTTHAEFVVLINRLGNADPEEFATLFQELLAHTRAHFAMEEELMRLTHFPGRREHLTEHGRVLGDMERFAERLAAGKTIFARAFVEDRVPDWFANHTRTLDSDLAQHLKAVGGHWSGEVG